MTTRELLLSAWALRPSRPRSSASPRSPRTARACGAASARAPAFFVAAAVLFFARARVAHRHAGARLPLQRAHAPAPAPGAGRPAARAPRPRRPRRARRRRADGVERWRRRSAVRGSRASARCGSGTRRRSATPPRRARRVQRLQTALAPRHGARVLVARPRAARADRLPAARRRRSTSSRRASACTMLGIIVTLLAGRGVHARTCTRSIALGVLPLAPRRLGAHARGGPAARRAPDVGPGLPRLRGRDPRDARPLLRARSDASRRDAARRADDDRAPKRPTERRVAPTGASPSPTSIPRPTYWPAAMAFGLTFLLWGLVTSPVVLGVGVVVFVVSLVGWIGEMRHERRERSAGAPPPPRRADAGARTRSRPRRADRSRDRAAPAPRQDERRRWASRAAAPSRRPGGRLRRRAALPRRAARVARGRQGGRLQGRRDGERRSSSTRRPSPGRASPRRPPRGCAASSDDEFVAFSVNCAHLGCPVRWLREAHLFMCPCHGGVYYEDGRVAAGPAAPSAHPVPGARRRRRRSRSAPTRSRSADAMLKRLPQDGAGRRSTTALGHLVAARPDARATPSRAARAGGTSSAARRCSRSSSRC